MNEYERLRRQAIVLRDMYPPGTRVECLCMNDPFAPVPSGTKGTVFHVDDMAQIHVNWDIIMIKLYHATFGINLPIIAQCIAFFC